MKTEKKITEEDIGAAMMAWYEDAIKQYPEGLITQAQAANMLGVSRVIIGRLLNRGSLRAVYFPKPPDVSGIVVGDDDPTWLKIVGWLGISVESEGIYWPKACYVSFSDVKRLWEKSNVQAKCKRNWAEIRVCAQALEEEHAQEAEAAKRDKT